MSLHMPPRLIFSYFNPVQKVTPEHVIAGERLGLRPDHGGQ